MELGEILKAWQGEAEDADRVARASKQLGRKNTWIRAVTKAEMLRRCIADVERFYLPERWAERN